MRNIAHGRGDSFPLFTKLLALSNKHSARPKGREGKWRTGETGKSKTDTTLFCSFPFRRFAFALFPRISTTFALLRMMEEQKGHVVERPHCQAEHSSRLVLRPEFLPDRSQTVSPCR
jgi:hypothetical protein